MWARIENGTVAEITDIDPAGRFHPSLEWVACREGVAPGWIYADAAFTGPMEMPPPQASREEIEALRLRAYADPITGSDRYFAEAQRESLMGNAEASAAAKVLGIKRFSEIQAEHRWPANALTM